MSILKVNAIRATAASSDAITLATDGTCTAKITNIQGRKNRIINGNFSIWQRGTSGFTTNDVFTADRWRMIESGGTATASRGTFAVGSELAGSEYYLNYNVTTASDYTGMKYRIEDVKSIEPGTWTISFWAKHTSAGPNGGLMIRGDQNFGSGGSTGVSLTSPAAITTTTSWVRYSANITIPSISGKTVGASSYLQLEIGQGSNAGTGAWNLDIANVQFEKGEVATDFEYSSYGDELLRCQRYYQVDRSSNVNSMYESATTYNGKWYQRDHPVEMRIKPTVSTANGTNGISNSGWTGSTPTPYSSNTHTVYYSSGNAYHLAGTSDGNIGATYDSEL